MGRGALDHRVQITHAPGRIAGAQVAVELGIGRGGVAAALPERPVQIERRAALEQRRGAGQQPRAGGPRRDVQQIDADDPL